MSLSPNEKYPGATADDPNYKAGKFKDNNPSTINNGSPLKAIDRNERLALEEAIMTDAGLEYNGTPDTPQDSQMFKAYKASLSNGKNLLSNHNFIIPSPDESQPAPDGTARSYPAGYEIFSGVFANETTGITNLTYSNGLVSFTAGDFYIPVANTDGIENTTEFVASVADFDGKPRQLDPSSWSLIGNEYRVTVGVSDLAGGPLGSVKFEQGSVATGHEVGDYIGSIGVGSLDVNGYVVLPQKIGGKNLILQWGNATGGVVTNFPIPFPNGRVLTGTHRGADVQVNVVEYSDDATNASFRFGTSPAGGAFVQWIAIGY